MAEGIRGPEFRGGHQRSHRLRPHCASQRPARRPAQLADHPRADAVQTGRHRRRIRPGRHPV